MHHPTDEHDPTAHPTGLPTDALERCAHTLLCTYDACTYYMYVRLTYYMYAHTICMHIPSLLVGHGRLRAPVCLLLIEGEAIRQQSDSNQIAIRQQSDSNQMAIG